MGRHDVIVERMAGILNDSDFRWKMVGGAPAVVVGALQSMRSSIARASKLTQALAVIAGLNFVNNQGMREQSGKLYNGMKRPGPRWQGECEARWLYCIYEL
jgi:hypothetical protein